MQMASIHSTVSMLSMASMQMAIMLTAQHAVYTQSGEYAQSGE